MERQYKTIIKELFEQIEISFQDNIFHIKDESNYGEEQGKSVIAAGEVCEHEYANKSCLLNIEKFLDGYFQCYDVAYEITGDINISRNQQTKYLEKNKLTLVPQINSQIDYNSSVGESFDYIAKVLSHENDEKLLEHVKEQIPNMMRDYFNSNYYKNYLFLPLFNSLNNDFYLNKLNIDIKDMFENNPYVATIFYSAKKNFVPGTPKKQCLYGIAAYSDELFEFFQDNNPSLNAIKNLPAKEKQDTLSNFIGNVNNLEKLAILFEVSLEMEVIPNEKKMNFLESRIKNFSNSVSQNSNSSIFNSAKEQLYRIESKYLINKAIQKQSHNETEVQTSGNSFKL